MEEESRGLIPILSEGFLVYGFCMTLAPGLPNPKPLPVSRLLPILESPAVDNDLRANASALLEALGTLTPPLFLNCRFDSDMGTGGG